MGTEGKFFFFGKTSPLMYVGFSVPEKPEKRRFSFHEKQVRNGFNVTFSLVRKSNPKVHQRVATLWTPGSGSKFRAVNYLLKRKFCAYQEISTKICNLVPYSSEYFEPVRKDNFTAQGFVGIYKKTCSDLGGQQVMCFRKWESLAEICF